MATPLARMVRVTCQLLLLASCGPRPPPPTPAAFVAGAAAQAQGVATFEVLHSTATDLDVRFSGRRQGRLQVQGGSGVVTQRLAERARAPATLRTSWGRVDLESGGSSHLIAERPGAAWIPRAHLDDATRSAVALIFALDIDLAVQGTSMAFEGRLYAWCTRSCVAAEQCVRQGDLDRCADQAATCGACLQQEPVR